MLREKDREVQRCIESILLNTVEEVSKEAAKWARPDYQGASEPLLKEWLEILKNIVMSSSSSGPGALLSAVSHINHPSCC